MKISLVIPVYNEQIELAEVLAKYVTDLKHLCAAYQEQNVTYEIIAVNDGSSDLSAKMLSESARLNRNIRVINFDARYGKQAAVTAGLEEATGDCVILADVDIVNPMGVLKRVFEEFMNGHQIVYAYRESIGFERLHERASEAFTNLAAGLFGVSGRYMGRPRVTLFSRNVADVLVALPAKNKLMRSMDNWLGWSIRHIQYASAYNKREKRDKDAAMKNRFKERGGDIVQRSKVREHSIALLYARAFLIATVILAVTEVVLLIVAKLAFMFHFFMWLIILACILLAVAVFARAVLIKRVGLIHSRESEEIFNVASVIN